VAEPTTAPATTRGERTGVIPAYRALVRSRVRAQTSYRLSFAVDVAGAVGIGAVDLAEVYVVFHQVDSLGGFTFAQVALMYGLAGTAFALADLAVGHVDHLPMYVRTGQLDSFLLRPLSALGQLLTSDFSLRRLGRTFTALVTAVVALLVVDVDWTPARIGLLLLTPVAGFVIFCAVFVAAAATTFWLVESTELGSAFTYGGSYLATWPTSIFVTPVRRFFTFVIPASFVAYLPTLALLGRDDPAGLPAWLSWCALPVSLAALGVALLYWRAGLRHYVGAGS
jgi:ABC-2 type transport system permease protein